MAQVVEHLPPAALVRVAAARRREARPGGLLVAETINPLSPLALRHYFADLTHAQPLVPRDARAACQASGIRVDRDPVPQRAAERLGEPDDPVIAANVRRLNEVLFAPLDYALLARNPAHE
jgi:hypothetical protein